MQEMNGHYFDPNNYTGSDIERINKAVKDAAAVKGTVRIGKRTSSDANSPARDFWLIDSAILVYSNLHVIIDNCTVKLSDQCRDNMIRSGNCGIGIKEVLPLENIHISGRGNAILEGADIPRSTGDAAKLLYKPQFIPEGVSSFGTDAGIEGENQKGDFRNVGILMAEVHGFSIEGLTIKDSHCWAISLEYCTRGKVRDMEFYSAGKKLICGQEELIRNQDGLDLRRGCRDILIENISGATGDDLIALTAIASKPRPSGELAGAILGGDEDVSRGDVCNIIIRNVRGYCAGGHHIVRFLNTKGVKICNVILDGLIDTSGKLSHNRATVKIGDNNPAWGGVTPLGDTFGFHISNIHSFSKYPIMIAGSLQDSTISNVVDYNPETEGVFYDSGKEYTKNLVIQGIVKGTVPK